MKKYSFIFMVLMIFIFTKAYAINALPYYQNKKYLRAYKQHNIKKYKPKKRKVKITKKQVKEKFRFHLLAFFLGFIIHFLLLFTALLGPYILLLSQVLGLILIPNIWGRKVNKRKSISWSWFLGVLTLIGIFVLFALLIRSGILIL